MIYTEVLEVESIQSVRIPPKPSINNMLRHSRSEENIAEGEGNPPSSTSTREISLCVESPPSSSASNLPTTANSSQDLHLGSDCWSQEDDEISLQVVPHSLVSYFLVNWLVQNSKHCTYEEYLFSSTSKWSQNVVIETQYRKWARTLVIHESQCLCRQLIFVEDCLNPSIPPRILFKEIQRTPVLQC